MEMKHVIIFAIIGIVALLGFNIINGNSREQNREIATSSVAAEQPDSTVATSDTDITSQPLSQQPKAIVDSATSKIDQAQQAEQDRVDQLDDAQ
ncbi:MULTISPECIES: hypothetical protein [Psychrobacter]|jgi:hypothetical protein|uniref:Uncharacterized protein n=1 Tax=Psychrobacter proteolyticus TaxID=147825 RepID=A0ABV0D779_9GAMM|nr:MULTISPECIES: hypothetical protein [Psychrobacter]TEW83449.1 hypothetical protein E2545_11155 [Psychrobacter sp. 230]|tara:strand:- start:1567 stop:1848 length:282 start_codon:yes stop_codon:yes gene_type:complete